jgi:hypothetical protein
MKAAGRPRPTLLMLVHVTEFACGGFVLGMTSIKWYLILVFDHI